MEISLTSELPPSSNGHHKQSSYSQFLWLLLTLTVLGKLQTVNCNYQANISSSHHVRITFQPSNLPTFSQIAALQREKAMLECTARKFMRREQLARAASFRLARMVLVVVIMIMMENHHQW